MKASRLAVAMLCLSLGLFRPAWAQVVPPPPQAPAAADGIDGSGFARVAAGAAGFVDAYSRCRYLRNGAGFEEVIPLSSSAEWLSWRTSPPASDTQTVCCRPSTTTLCQGATGGTVTAPVNGTGVNGYGILNGTGTATATCNNPPYGSYQDARTFVCGQTGSGVNADGQWSQSGGDTDSCSANSYVTYGGCSTAGSGGWGNLYETLYNSCGQVAGQGYFGPSCYTQPPCTPNWKTSSSGCTGGSWQTVTTYDANSCPGSTSSTTTQACYYWIITRGDGAAVTGGPALPDDPVCPPYSPSDCGNHPGASCYQSSITLPASKCVPIYEGTLSPNFCGQAGIGYYEPLGYDPNGVQCFTPGATTQIYWSGAPASVYGNAPNGQPYCQGDPLGWGPGFINSYECMQP